MLAPAGLGAHEHRLDLVRLGNDRLLESCGNIVDEGMISMSAMSTFTISKILPGMLFAPFLIIFQLSVFISFHDHFFINQY